MYHNQTQNKVVTIDSVLAKELFGSAKGAVDRGFELENQVFYDHRSLSIWSERNNVLNGFD